jgi:hypothetical protein
LRDNVAERRLAASRGAEVKNLLVFLALVAAVVLGGKYAWTRFEEKTFADQAEKGTRALFTAMQAGSARGQEALCLWATGAPICGEDAIRAHTDPFDRWRQEHGLETVREFRVEPAEVERAGSGLEARVEVTVGARALRLRVRRDAPLEVLP